MAALGQARRSYKPFEPEMAARAARTLAGIKPGGKTFVMISKIYGVADQMLHMGVPDRLREMGHEVLPFHALPANDIFTRHPNMYCPSDNTSFSPPGRRATIRTCTPCS
jgi:hypothetical protein